MKHSTLKLILFIEAAICIIAALAFTVPGSSSYLVIAQFPFAQIGLLLRTLSLSGVFGNVAAIILYAALCLLPFLFIALHAKKQTLRVEDWLLVIMSGFAFYIMYMMINPGYLGRIPSFINEDVGKAALGGAFYSLLVGYLVLKLLRKSSGTGTDSLLKILRLLFAVTAVILVFSICYVGIGDVNAKLAAIQSANTDPSVALGFTNFFVILRYVLTQLPVFMELVIFLMAMRLCEHLRADRYGEDAVSAAKKLASFCKKTVAVILLCIITLNLAQILFAGFLVSVDFQTTLPLDSVIVAFTALLLSRFFTASRELAQDNQMFI
jgi:hypothetical protein